MPKEVDKLSRNEKLNLLALARLNEEEKLNKLKLTIASAISLAYGGED